MTEKEWIDIGYQSNVIDARERESCAVVPFCEAYKLWFCMKMKIVKPDTLDRIEVTYRRYYQADPFVDKAISAIADGDVIDFLSGCIFKNPDMTYKEYKRILQIVNNVLVYCKDLNLGGARLYDWDKIKRYLPLDKLEKTVKPEFAIKERDVANMIDLVLNHNIYPVKQNACLCLCMNFYLGLRIGELAALTFDDFDFDRNIVRIYKTQSKSFNRTEDGERCGTMVYRVVDDVKTVYSVRELPLLPEVRRFYEKIKHNHLNHKYESPYLAYDGADIVLYQSLDHTLRKLCQLCDIPYFNTHVIRKTFATKLHFAGVPTRVISDLMGHSEIATTENSYILSYANNYDKILNYMENGLKYHVEDR